MNELLGLAEHVIIHNENAHTYPHLLDQKVMYILQGGILFYLPTTLTTSIIGGFMYSKIGLCLIFCVSILLT